MKLDQLHDLYEMLIVKRDLERLQTELFITHFEIFQHLPVYAASYSVDISTKDLQNTKHKC